MGAGAAAGVLLDDEEEASDFEDDASLLPDELLAGADELEPFSLVLASDDAPALAGSASFAVELVLFL
ncbi:MAG: hypothetical protein AB7P40_18690 [Chloroflexota bacterium]